MCVKVIQAIGGTFFETQCKERKGRVVIKRFLVKVVHSKRSGMDHTVLPANNTMPAFPS